MYRARNAKSDRQMHQLTQPHMNNHITISPCEGNNKSCQKTTTLAESQPLYYSHITQTDGRPTVGEPKMGKSGDVGQRRHRF